MRAASEPPKAASADKLAAPEKPAAAPPVVVKGAVKMPPLKGSHVAEDNNYCLQCHTTADSFEGDSKRSYIAMDLLKKDVHNQKGVNCVDCHGGDPTKPDAQAHQTDDFRSKLPQIKQFCAYCHKQEADELSLSDHHAAGPRNESGEGTLLSCDACHGELAHGLLPVKDAQSPVHLQNQIQKCGGCDKDRSN